jgi:uncharacterized protein (TIGR02145 family)
MKQKQRVALLCMAVVALIFAACDGDSGNNGTEMEGDSSSSTGIYSSGGQMNSSPAVKSSSSSAGASSSGVKAQSSSSSIKQGTLIYGGQTYKTVVIGTQTWMAENLNYAVDSSWCYENSADSCAKYGRLYQWAAAMGVSATYNDEFLGDSVKHQGVCPSGWHIPRNSEWTTLENAVGGEDVAGRRLKSRSGWIDEWDESGNGTDRYGFSALPAGNRYGNGYFCYVGARADFWSATDGTSATEFDWVYAFYWSLDFGYASMDTGNSFKNYAFSVRCVQDF